MKVVGDGQMTMAMVTSCAACRNRRRSWAPVDRRRFVLLRLWTLLALLSCIVWQPARAEVAGTVVALRMWAYGTPPETKAKRDLFLMSEVESHELLETVAQGALHVRLLDDTMLRLGSATSVVVDEFIYDPEADATTFVASISKGVCRFLSGKTKERRFEVTTPAATIVARGTVFSVWLKPDGTTTVWVQEGEVEVTPRDGAAAALVGEGEIVLAPIAGGGVQLDAPRPSPDPGIADTARVRIFRKKSIK